MSLTATVDESVIKKINETVKRTGKNRSMLVNEILKEHFEEKETDEAKKQ
jgi:metal-responsive CopG/Arc/MetJ family transcriptional regulator